MNWYVYLLECSDGTYYTGITNNISRRILLHNSGKASRYTRGRLPVKLIASKKMDNKSDALSEEYRIKQLSRRKKLHSF